MKATGYSRPTPPPSALKRVREGVDLVLLDYRLPDSDGLAVLKQIKENDPDTLVIMLTAYSNVDTAVEAMRQGAYHYANKPFNMDEIVLLVEKALETTSLRREVRALRANQAQPYSLDRIVGDDESMYDDAGAAEENCDRSGIDGAAHRRERNGQGSRRQGDSLHQPARQQAVHEHHLFGASRNAARERAVRSRARRVYRGRPPEARPASRWPTAERSFSTKSARWCRCCRRSCCDFSKRNRSSGSAAPPTSKSTCGSSLPPIAISKRKFARAISGRIFTIASTSCRLRCRRCVSGPTISRGLVNFYVDLYNTEFRKRIRRVAPSAMEQLQAYPWPGNVRELRNAVERAMLLADGDELDGENFPVGGRLRPRRRRRRTAGQRRGSRAVGAVVCVQALERSGWNQTRAARCSD